MSVLPLGLVLASAMLHATWNLLAKRARGGVVFLWAFSLGTVLLYTPVALLYFILEAPAFTTTHLGLALGSGVLHLGYFSCLQRGYRAGDLSLVYPLARGSGPALATALAILLLGERPGTQALVGTALVVASVFVLSSGTRSAVLARRAAIGYGLLTGLFIASYTVWDGFAVGRAGASPLLYLMAGEVARTLLVTPLALRRPDDLRELWRDHRLEVVGVAVLAPGAYLLVLTALQLAPISLVAPVREIGILFATVLGTRALAEGEGRKRAFAAVAMVTGVVLLALA